MRKMLAPMALFGLIAFLTIEANAQRQGGGMGRGGQTILIMNKSVQEEIKLTDEQKDQVKEKMAGIQEKQKENFGKLKELSKEERGEKMAAMQKEINAEVAKELSTILKPEQSKRLKQIERQQTVLVALTNDEEVVKVLKITEEQKEKLKALNEEFTKESGELRKSGGKDNFKETQEKVTALRKETTEKAVKVLTTEQAAKWKELTGEPFEVKNEFGGGGKGKRKKKDDV
jgi:Spy/CpxP family protein refolding chaperone